MANVNIEFQGDFQYLKYEFTPRLRALIKNVHTVMNSYNAAFFERCKGFGDLESIKREALATGRLPQGVESAMKAAGALKPIAATIGKRIFRTMRLSRTAGMSIVYTMSCEASLPMA